MFLFLRNSLFYAKIVQSERKECLYSFPRSSLSYAKIVQSERTECLYSFPRSSLSYAKLLINICSCAQSKQLLTYKWLVLFSLFMLLFYGSDSLEHLLRGISGKEIYAKHLILFRFCEMKIMCKECDWKLCVGFSD